MDTNLRKYLAPSIIIAVTFFAFLAGSLQANYTNKANNTQAIINTKNDLITKMDNQIHSITSEENSLYLQASNSYSDIFNSIFSYFQNYVSADKQAYESKILLDFQQANFYVYGMKGRVIDAYFSQNCINCVTGYNANYTLASKNKDGYDFILEKSQWTSPFQTKTIEDYLTGFGIFNDSILPFSVCFTADATNSTNSDMCYIYNMYKKHEMTIFSSEAESNNFYIPIQDQITIRDNASANLVKYKYQADAISRGVTITTIATVLATAMSSGLENKDLYNYLSEIRSDINKDPQYKMKNKGTITYLGLIVSVIIALLGLGIPLLFS